MGPSVEQVFDRPPAVPKTEAKSAAIPWAALAWFTALLIAVDYPTLRGLVEQWSTDEDVSHGFFVPLVALFIAWQRREQILALDAKPAWWGLGVMAWGALQGYLERWARNRTFSELRSW